MARRDDAHGMEEPFAANQGSPAVPRRDSAVLRSAIVDRLPLGLRGARFGLTARSVAVFVIAGLLGAALGLAYLLRSRPAQVDLPPPVVAVSPAVSPTAGGGVPGGGVPGQPPPTDLAGSPGSVGTHIVVDVEGKVRRPGIVRVPQGARVMDAVEAAGGILPGTDTAALNLARVLADGEQILVGVSPPPRSTPTGGPSDTLGAPLDLNTATLDQLEELPGVGPVLAQRILDYRTAHGRFSSVDELREVSGIGDQRFAELKDLVRV